MLWVAGVSLGFFVQAILFVWRNVFPNYNYRDIAPALAGASILLVSTALVLDLAARRANRFLFAATLAHVAGQGSVLVGLWITSGCPGGSPCVNVIFVFVLVGLGFGIAAIVLGVTGFADERIGSSWWIP